MDIEISPEARKQSIASIKRYFDEQLDTDIGDLKAEMMLGFVLKEIAPSVYNQAIQDAQTFVRDRVVEMDSSLFAREFGYWEKAAKRK